MTNAHSETGQMAVCCQNLPLGALSSRSAPPVLVGALFKKFGLFLNTPHIAALEVLAMAQKPIFLFLHPATQSLSDCVHVASCSFS
jgi:hypothetical protein